MIIIMLRKTSGRHSNTSKSDKMIEKINSQPSSSSSSLLSISSCNFSFVQYTNSPFFGSSAVMKGGLKRWKRELLNLFAVTNQPYCFVKKIACVTFA